MEGLGAKPEFDLAVIGGGPGGASAAITAARAGASVALFERGKLPRQRVCGEFVSAESLDLLAGLLDSHRSHLLRPALRIPEARLFFDGRTVTTPVEPAAASISRFDLDATLLLAAQSANVATHVQTAVENIFGEGPFVLETSAGRISARAVINAAGRWSNLRSHTLNERLKIDSGKWLGVKAHFRETNPHSSVDLYFFDGGYCGVQPVKEVDDNSGHGRVNACAMVRSDVARSLSEVLDLQPQLKQRARKWQLLMEPVTTSPLIFGEPAPVENNILLAGDAAGFVDPFVGDGISLALRSGALAAGCLVPFFSDELSLRASVENYAQAYRQHLLPIFRNSSRLRRLLKLPRPIRKSIGHLLQATPAVSRMLVRMTR